MGRAREMCISGAEALGLDEVTRSYVERRQSAGRDTEPWVTATRQGIMNPQLCVCPRGPSLAFAPFMFLLPVGAGAVSVVTPVPCLLLGSHHLCPASRFLSFYP